MKIVNVGDNIFKISIRMFLAEITLIFLMVSHNIDDIWLVISKYGYTGDYKV